MENKSYQNTIATLFSLSWAFLILDRQAITFLFPVLSEVFHLNNAQTGNIVMVTGLGFVISSLFITPLADRSGLKKPWLVAFVILTGLFSGATAFAGILTTMLVVRFLTGLAEGPVYPLMTSILTIQCDPKRFATYIGIIQFTLGLIAMVIGPTLTIQLSIHLNWQYAFIFTSLPTVIVGILIWIVLKEVKPPRVKSGIVTSMDAPEPGAPAMKWGDIPKIFAYRNCTISYIANVLTMIGFWGVISFGTIYWVNEGGLTLEQTGYMTSLSGVVGLVWSLFIPILLNRLGRKPSVAIFTLYITASMFILYTNQGLLAQVVFVLVIGCYGFMSVLFVAIICQESVPPAIAATTTAIGMAIGEIIGTTIAPRILGSLGDIYGLRTIFLVAGISSAVSFFITLGLTETRNTKQL